MSAPGWIVYGICGLINLGIFFLALFTPDRKEKIAIVAWGIFASGMLVFFSGILVEDIEESQSFYMYVVLAIGWALLSSTPILVWSYLVDRNSGDAIFTSDHSQRIETIPKSARIIPKLTVDLTSELRARGMTKLYGNWRSCYLILHRPSGQQVKTEVLLVEEPHNLDDNHAIIVTYRNLKLGYIPREIAPTLKPLIMQVGGVVRAEAELWFDFRSGQKRNSVRLLVARPFSIE